MFWLAMLAASALGTNVGDVPVDLFDLAVGASFGLLAAFACLAIAADRALAARTEAWYWIAIVALRAAATNVGDFLTHDAGLGYVAVSVLLAALTLAAGFFSRSSTTDSGTPLIDLRYWGAMFLAGIFGTVAGDLCSHTLGLPVAAILLCLVTGAVIVIRGRFAPIALLSYWCVVLAERTAGTSLGDTLASRHGAGLGLPLAMVFSACVLGTCLAARRATKMVPVDSMP